MSNQNQPVDMIEIARQTTMRDINHLMPGSIKIIAPAKVNIHLAVGSAQSDGYHLVCNTMHALSLHDVLYMTCTPAAPQDDSQSTPTAPQSIHIDIIPTGGFALPDIPTERNLVYRAIVALAEAINRTQHETISVRIEKNIPAQAGLGGGSSDAAAALLGIAKLWDLDPSDPRVLEVAQRLGADVAFFLQGGCATFGHYGEQLVQTHQPRKDNVVLFKPEMGLGTAEVYRRFDELGCASALASTTWLCDGSSALDVPLLNSLEQPAFDLLPDLQHLASWAAAQPGVVTVQMSGSGSAFFAICKDFASASALTGQAKLKNLWARSTSFSGARAAIVPTRR